MGQGLLGYYASKARERGKSLEENAEYIAKMIPKVQHWVMADDLHHLRRGGRVSGASAFVGTMLNIKPVLSVLADGRLAPLHKVRGRAKALSLFLDEMEKNVFNPKDQKVFIAHSDCLELAEQLRDMITAKFGSKDFLINEIGPVIGSHTGPGTIAMMYLGEGSRPAGS
jgi:DegV family protein with EDD domain